MTKQEELLRAIFEGPVRPLTKEQQEIEDAAREKYEGISLQKNAEYAELLGLTIEEVERERRENLMGLIERVAIKKMQDPHRVRRLRALLAPR